jgi:hypothetical protein
VDAFGLDKNLWEIFREIIFEFQFTGGYKFLKFDRTLMLTFA